MVCPEAGSANKEGSSGGRGENAEDTRIAVRVAESHR
jgi:hypothetical protein